MLSHVRAALRPPSYLRPIAAFSTVVRRVLDIGSGSIKCEVAEVEPTSKRIVRSIFSASVQTLFLRDLKHSGSDSMLISPEMYALGMHTIKNFIADTNHLGVTQTAAVATEAFRKAANGKAVVAAFARECGVEISVIQSEQEARLGYESARALSGLEADALLAWDCGAGSFQLSNGSDSHVDIHGSGTMRAVASAMEAGLTRGQLSEALLAYLRTELKTVPLWLQTEVLHSVVAIGSSQSIFNQQRVLSGLVTFDQFDVERTLAEVAAIPEHMLPALERERSASLEYVVKEENAQYALPKLALLLGAMRHLRIGEVTFKPTNGNCLALLTHGDLWPSVPSPVFSEGTLKPVLSEGTLKPVLSEGTLQPVLSEGTLQPVSSEPARLLTVNWHLEKHCNYKCSFCYAHFADVVKGLEKADGIKLLRSLRDAGFFKVNFAGGEPLLNQHLGEYVKAAKELGLKTSIITNASRLTATWLESYGPFLDQIGVSCDSLDDQVNKEMGRGFGNHVAVTERALRRVHQLNETRGLDVKVKLNTVVMRQNHFEDWSDFIVRNGVQRWKVFKVLRIEGENDKGFEDKAVSDVDFEAFVARHAHLEKRGVVVAAEDNDAMTLSYVMVTPDGRFYQNTDGRYTYSEPVLAVGVDEALRQTGFDYEKFVDRGGAYRL
jgi:radical S-adenosyl methionine domain-containing protein 2